MGVGKYQIGCFHAIIRKEYADGSVDYETSFTDIEDFNESYYIFPKTLLIRLAVKRSKGSILL